MEGLVYNPFSRSKTTFRDGNGEGWSFVAFPGAGLAFGTIDECSELRPPHPTRKGGNLVWPPGIGQFGHDEPPGEDSLMRLFPEQIVNSLFLCLDGTLVFVNGFPKTTFHIRFLCEAKFWENVIKCCYFAEQLS